MTENEIATVVVDSAYKVHVGLGPGLLESIYEVTLCHELKKRGLTTVRQLPVPIVYDGLHFDEGFRADVLVQDKVLLELKSVENVLPVHKKQTLTYIRLMDKRLGLMMNFGAARMKDGIWRIVNGLEE